MADPLLDAETEAQALLGAVERVEQLERELAAAHALLAEWREGVVAANRLSQEFEARAVRAESSHGPRKCPDCGSLRFDQGGAAALDEAREVGFGQGVEAAVKICNGRASAHDVGSEAQREAWKCASSILAASIRPSPTPPTLAERRTSPTPRAEVAKARERMEGESAPACAGCGECHGTALRSDGVHVCKACGEESDEGTGCGYCHGSGCPRCQDISRAPSSDVKGGGK